MIRRAGWLVAAFGLGAILFWQLRPLPAPAALFLTLLLVALPVAMMLQAGAGDLIAATPRLRIYRESIASLWGLAVATAGIAWLSGYSFRDVGIVAVPAPALLGWAAAMTAAGVAVMFAARALGIRETALVAHLMPESAPEKAAFAGLSLTAGICEEFVFRGFVMLSLLQATNSWIVAVAVSSGVFGVVHAYQQPAGALRAATLGALLAVPVVVTGSILPSVVAHAAIDLLAGFVLRDRLLRD